MTALIATMAVSLLGMGIVETIYRIKGKKA